MLYHGFTPLESFTSKGGKRAERKAKSRNGRSGRVPRLDALTHINLADLRGWSNVLPRRSQTQRKIILTAAGISIISKFLQIAVSPVKEMLRKGEGWYNQRFHMFTNAAEHLLKQAKNWIPACAGMTEKSRNRFK